MTLIYDFSLLLNTIFFGLSIFLAIVLWNQKTTFRRSNRMLTLLLVAFAATTFNTIIRLTHYIETLNFYQEISNVFLLTMGPSIYLFIKIRVEARTKHAVLVHFIPFIIYSSLLLIYNLTSLASGKDIIDGIAFLTFVSQFIVYTLMSFKLLNSYEGRARQNFSNMEKHNMNWVKIVLSALLITLFLRLSLLVYSALVRKVLDVIGLNLTLGFAVATCYLGYKIFRKPELFVQLPSYHTSGLSTDELSSNRKLIDSAMQSYALYLNPKLTIADLAKQAGLHSRQVSQTLSQELQQNFFDYVNKYRVQALKKQLLKPDAANYKLQSLMEEAGFQSPSVAYAAFKKYTGTTPAQFRKSN